MNSLRFYVQRLVLLLPLVIMWSPRAQVQRSYKSDASGNITNIATATGVAPSSFFGRSTIYVYVGEKFSLSSSQGGTPPNTYRWQRDSADVSGATNDTFYVRSAALTDSGIYNVIISNSSGSITNRMATISVLPTRGTLYKIAYGNSRYLSIGDGGTIVSSTDFNAWTIPTSPTTNRLEGIVYSGTKFVAVGEKGTVITSTDGVSWTAQSSGNTNDLKSIAYGSGTFVAVGSKGTIITSSDGVSWTTRTFDNVNLTAIAFGNARFVAVGTSGTIWVSTNNGVGWNDYTWHTAAALNAVTYANSKYVVVGTGGLILTSSDSVSWSQSAVATTEDFQAVAYFNSAFFALGPFGTVFLSADGVLWDNSGILGLDPLLGVAVGNNNLVASGKNGALTVIPISVLDHFTFNTISTAQRAGQSFSVTITAKDSANNTITGFTGSATLSATALSAISTNNLLGNISYTSSGNSGTNVYGYSFTPDKDITLTHFRTYFGKAVSIWSVEQDLIASLPITNAPGSWSLTPISPPLLLKGAQTYIIGAYSESTYYTRSDGVSSFADGTIDQGLLGPVNAVPWQAMADRWFLVDFQYLAQRPQAVTITPSSAIFSSGTSTVSASVSSAARNVVIQASYLSGSNGLSNPFNVYGSDDLAITMTDSADPISSTATLTYTITVLNPTASSANGVLVTNTLPLNVTNITASASQGTPQIASGKVTCNMGTIAAQSSATMTISMTPTAAGVVLSTTTTAKKTETDSDLSNNVMTETTYVLPTLTVTGFSTSEGNLGTKTNYAAAIVSPPTPYTVWFDIDTANGTGVNGAIAGQDYQQLDTRLGIPPNTGAASIPIYIYGDTIGEGNETFYLNFSNAQNASLGTTQVAITINNDDDIVSQVDAFAWNTIFTPRRVDAAFTATITAKDFQGATVSSFTGTNSLSAFQIGGSTTNRLLTNAVPTQVENNGTYTLGYSFTPNVNLLATHVRQYSGSKVILWADEGYPLATNISTIQQGTWTESLLSPPIPLRAGKRYRISFLSGGQNYYSQTYAPIAFAHGTINGSYYAVGDAFPNTLDNSAWYMVDLRYSLPASITPTNTGNFVAGSWTGSLTVKQTGDFRFMADENNGHIGFSGLFSVYATNDMALNMIPSTTAPLVGTNFTYQVSVVNPGPNSSPNVKVTNTLPANATYVGTTATQGTTTVNGNTISWDVGAVGNLSSATMTITVTPTVAGATLTNVATAFRTETDPNPDNNTAVSILIPNLAVSVLLGEATDTNLVWKSYGSSSILWGQQTNVTHDGIDAAQSGVVTHGQGTYMETSIRGPGTLTFWWKVSSESGGDRFYFYTNGWTMANITGNVDWQQFTYNVPASLVTVTWGYVKDANISAGSDAAWLDQVNFVVPAFSFNQMPAITNGAVYLTLNGTNGQRLIIQGSQNLSMWTSLTTNFVTNSTILYTDQQATNFPYRFYRAIHRNE
jgi:uncharacterized repeat protein (TIGR01451 family)